VQVLGDGARMIVPVTDRGDAIGLLELDLPYLPTPREVADIGSAAPALAYVVIAARRHTDVFEWGQRSTPFALAAEIQRRLLPTSYTCEAGQFTLAGWLEPASSVGGTRSTPPWTATGAGRAWAWPSRPATPTTRWRRTPLRVSSSPVSCCASTCTRARWSTSSAPRS
jgi:hypothetical protein